VGFVPGDLTRTPRDSREGSISDIMLDTRIESVISSINRVAWRTKMSQLIGGEEDTPLATDRRREYGYRDFEAM
jgi:hypothetical protein